MVAPIAPPNSGPTTTPKDRNAAKSRRRERSTSCTARRTSVAPTRGSARFASTKPQAYRMSWPCIRSTVSSAVPAAASTHGHIRHEVRIRAASVTPAGGKNTAPASDALNRRKATQEDVAVGDGDHRREPRGRTRDPDLLTWPLPLSRTAAHMVLLGSGATCLAPKRTWT